MKRKPLFRFLGRPQGGVRQQFEAAMLAQKVFFRVALEDGVPAAAALRAHHHVIENLREQLSNVGVAISEPLWFAALLNK